MRPQSAATQQRETTKQVKLVGADVSVNRQNEIRDMIARRAYESFERRGRIHGHDINDWIDAELEIVHPCRHELKEAAGSLIFLAELPGSFTADQISVSVEPRRLTVSAEREFDVTCGGNEPAHTEKRTQRIFQIEELPVDIDPSRAATKLDVETLEIVMPKLAGTNKPSEKVEAASSKP
jgi:HSP20 family molecular chaperone IbpA